MFLVCICAGKLFSNGSGIPLHLCSTPAANGARHAAAKESHPKPETEPGGAARFLVVAHANGLQWFALSQIISEDRKTEKSPFENKPPNVADKDASPEAIAKLKQSGNHGTLSIFMYLHKENMAHSDLALNHRRPIQPHALRLLKACLACGSCR